MMEAGEEVAGLARAWLARLAAERRLAPRTVAGYRADLDEFLGFLARHRGGPVGSSELAALAPTDIRAWLADRGDRPTPRWSARCGRRARW